MDALAEIFSHVCGRGRCFVADGAALPVCQRCLGLYVGAALTGVWLIASGLWRRGLPSWSVFIANATFLLAAMVGGLHWLDFGPAWRATCGLWAGHVMCLWLVGGAVHLRRLRRGRAQLPWRRRDEAAGLAAPALLGAVGAALPTWTRWGWYLWTAAILAGGAVLAFALTAGVVSACAHAATLRSRPSAVRPGG